MLTIEQFAKLAAEPIRERLVDSLTFRSPLRSVYIWPPETCQPTWRFSGYNEHGDNSWSNHTLFADALDTAREFLSNDPMLVIDALIFEPEC